LKFKSGHNRGIAEQQKARYVSIPEKPSVTKHQVTVNRKKIAYTATAGFLPFYDKKGEQKASFFYVAYVKEGTSNPARRPLTFCYNGGPGRNGVQPGYTAGRF
jgi:carboxypeptidase C (cathepsin A)